MTDTQNIKIAIAQRASIFIAPDYVYLAKLMPSRRSMQREVNICSHHRGMDCFLAALSQ